MSDHKVESDSESRKSTGHKTRHVLPQGMTGGPHGLGDPNDQTLRIVEREQIIPKRMRAKAKELCAEEEKVFLDCVKGHQWTFWKDCKTERLTTANCQIRHVQDPAFVQKCTEDYLRDRSEYRRTGLNHPKGLHTN